ncbi:hypothetical protein OEZ49_15370 [Ruegeria sp. WL0004]|uniref:Uncharacterized protein n=1 Tax=Ruegeria marisflavi TaxID=2984152 RepID=A0ABT2WVV4_9RHOB|nr:hypothetical protein [Ruegeria sp. WL0004]
MERASLATRGLLQMSDRARCDYSAEFEKIQTLFVRLNNFGKCESIAEIW